jgi:threonine dehydratase
MIDIEDIKAARTKIQDAVRHTPILPVSQWRDPLPCRVTMKLELQQVTGSFKARGAMNRVRRLTPAQLTHGLVTASGGNHGLAIARTGYVAGVPTKIFLPTNVAPDKIPKFKGWSADIEIIGADFDEANRHALAYAEKSGATYVHPFSDADVVAGQGTLGLEILQDMPDITVVLVAIGGGGLAAGLGTAIKALRPDIRIIGIEPVGAPTLHAALAAGHVVTLDKIETCVPTMASRATSEGVLRLIQASMEQVVLVTDDDMRKAAKSLWFENGIAADLSGAAAIAALQSGAFRPDPSDHVCAIVCGAGNDGQS